MHSKIIAELIQNRTRILRNKTREKIESFDDRNLSKPVTSWITEDRQRDEMGYEFTIIFRTCACSWARSDSSGCTMCGYFNDRGPESIDQKQILHQMGYAVKKHMSKLEEIQKQGKKTTLKIFSSGSFFDDSEFHPNTREELIKIAVKLPSITNILAETRSEYVQSARLNPIVEICDEKPFELGIGMESSNDYIRQVLINKGVTSKQLKNSIEIAHRHNCKVKTYLLLKPPFLTEKIAIRDAIQSIKDAVSWGADSISLNPVNVQAYTLTEYLFNLKKYRPPWIYSVIAVLQNGLTPPMIEKTLILCSPSAAGAIRGVHNCHDKSCNARWLQILHEFIATQNLNIINPCSLPYNRCSCWGDYNLYLENSLI